MRGAWQPAPDMLPEGLAVPHISHNKFIKNKTAMSVAGNIWNIGHNWFSLKHLFWWLPTMSRIDIAD